MEHTYFNRDISWLRFNERVLQEAEDLSNPLIERLRFLGIHSNNMDEFFRVRYSFIRRLRLSEEQGLDENLEGFTPGALLSKLSEIVANQQQRSQEIYDSIKEDLKRYKIEIINEGQLTAKQENFVKQLYREKVSPALTNLMINQTKNFPYLRDKSIYLAVRLTKKGQRTVFHHRGAVFYFWALCTVAEVRQAVCDVYGRCLTSQSRQYFSYGSVR